MPIWLRKFTYQTLKEHYDKIAEENTKAQNLLQNKNNKEVSRPNISPTKQPTYTAKAPKK